MSAVGSIAGGLISGVSNLIGGSNQNSAAAEQAAQAEQFSADQSSTVFQRGVADMRAAGLNPILAAGSPDPAASGVQAPVVNALGNAMNAGISNFSSLQSSRQVDPQIDNTMSSTNLNNALSAKAAADTTSALADARLTSAEADAKTSSPLVSKFIGSDATKAGASFLSNATDTVMSKIHDIIDGIHVNSAAKVPPPPQPNFGWDLNGGTDANGMEHFVPESPGIQLPAN